LFIDTHVHLDDEKYQPDLGAVLERGRAAGVGVLVSIGTSPKDSAWACDFADKNEGVYATVGMHPQFADQWKESDYAAFKELAGHEKVVAIGESGLDYHHPEPAKALQAPVFQAMLKLARESSLPLVIHQREASKDTLEALRQAKAQELGGVFHCFAGDAETAKGVLDLGFYIAVGGILTFPNAGALREVIRQVPLDRLVLETDGPWLAPQGRRGQRNEPAYLAECANKVAELKGVSLKDVEEASTANALKLFRLEAGVKR
jgi:TatD DNase family protein